MKEAAEFVSYIVSQVTGDPDCFHIETSLDERGVLLVLTVNQAQAGRVLGKGGSHALAMRSLLRALGTQNTARYSLQIEVDEDE